MPTRQTLLTQLDETVAQFTAAYRQIAAPDLEIYEGWSAKDILGHITFWHESFARNVDDLAHERKPTPLKGRLSDLNQQGVESTRALPGEAVLQRFESAHQVIQAHILNPRLVLIPYRKGSRDYTPEEHLQIVNDHIRAHLRAIEKTIA